MEDRAFPRRAVDRDRPVVALHYPIDHRQSKTRAFARRLGGEERVEDPFHQRLVHALAGIHDGEPRVATGSEHRMTRIIAHDLAAEGDVDSTHGTLDRV